MAVSKNDRISSAGLLDVLKGLQNDGHLGKEPEVTEKTITYERVVSPKPGTYDNGDSVIMASENTIDEKRLPFKVYTESGFSLDDKSITLSEPSGNYVELTKIAEVSNIKLAVENNFEEIETYTGYVLAPEGGSYYLCRYYENKKLSDNAYMWEMPEKTETQKTVIKRAIDPKYLPSPNWNENDPEAAGYIENRTHWAEMGVADVVPASGDGVLDFLTVPTYAKPQGFTWEGGEWYPDFEAVEISMEGFPAYILADDENGNQLTGSVEPNTAAHYVMIADTTATFGEIAVMAYVGGSAVPVQTVRMFSKVVHKLPQEFVDYSPVQNKLNYLDATTPFDYNGKGSGLVLKPTGTENLKVSILKSNGDTLYLKPWQYGEVYDTLNSSSRQIAIRRLFAAADILSLASVVEILTTGLSEIATETKTTGQKYYIVDNVTVERKNDRFVSATIKLGNGETVTLNTVKADGAAKCEIACTDPTLIDPETVNDLCFYVKQTMSGGLSHNPALNLLNTKTETACTASGSVLINPHFAWAFVNVQLSGGETSKTIKDNDLWAYVSNKNQAKGFGYFPTLKKHLLCDVTHDTDKESVTLTFKNEDGTAVTVPNGLHPGLCFITPFG